MQSYGENKFSKSRLTDAAGISDTSRLELMQAELTLEKIVKALLQETSTLFEEVCGATSKIPTLPKYEDVSLTSPGNAKRYYDLTASYLEWADKILDLKVRIGIALPQIREMRRPPERTDVHSKAFNIKVNEFIADLENAKFNLIDAQKIVLGRVELLRTLSYRED